MREHKNKIYSELKSKKGNKEYDDWFLNYKPAVKKGDEVQTEKKDDGVRTEKKAPFEKAQKKKKRKATKKRKTFFGIYYSTNNTTKRKKRKY